MNFVSTDIGMINLSHVQRIEETKNKGVRLVLSDGTIAKAHGTFEHMSERIGTIVPNNTACRGLCLSISDGEVIAEIQPIVAWRIIDDGALPILPGGDRTHFVLHENGRVDEISMNLHDNVDDAKAAFLSSNEAYERRNTFSSSVV